MSKYQITGHFETFRSTSNRQNTISGPEYILDVGIRPHYNSASYYESIYGINRMPKRSDSPDDFVQIRGFSSRDQILIEDDYCDGNECSGCDAIRAFRNYNKMLADEDLWKEEERQQARLGAIYGNRSALMKREIHGEPINTQYSDLYEPACNSAAACALINYYRYL